jgi:hypothetical protein
MVQKSETERLLKANLGEPKYNFSFLRSQFLPGEFSHGFSEGVADPI